MDELFDAGNFQEIIRQRQSADDPSKYRSLIEKMVESEDRRSSHSDAPDGHPDVSVSELLDLARKRSIQFGSFVSSLMHARHLLI